MDPELFYKLLQAMQKSESRIWITIEEISADNFVNNYGFQPEIIIKVIKKK